jgi:ATP-dependent exoDNAse (exonuclease V) beta subunit
MKLWGKRGKDKRTLKMRVGGEIVQVISTDEENKLALLDKEVQRIENVFECLSKIDKSVNSFDEKGIDISLQCPKFCPLANKEFCQDVVALASKELTKKMSLKTHVDTFGFVDYSR